MKTRQGFVSNSSSTSFLVSHLEQTGMKMSVQVEIDLTEYIRKTLHTEEELRHYFSYNYGDDFLKREYTKKSFDSALKELQEGKTVSLLVFNNNSCDPLGDYLYGHATDSMLETVSGLKCLSEGD